MSVESVLERSCWVRADFNGVFGGEFLCLSHSDEVRDESGRVLRLRPGLLLTAFDEDADDQGRPDPIIASGAVEPSPSWLQCNGSKWVLRIDAQGIRHVSDLSSPTQ